eukprot:353785_1
MALDIARGQTKPSGLRLAVNSVHCLLLLIIGQTVYCFGLYSQALRQQLGFSTLGTQFIYNFGLLGFSIGTAITGRVLEIGGPRLALGLGAVTGSGGALLTMLAVKQVFSCPVELFWALAFLTGFGQGFPYITGITTNTRNFAPEQRGKIVGLTMAFSIMSSSFYSVVWKNFYLIDDGDYSRAGQDVTGFWVFITLLLLITNVLGMLHVRRWEYEDEPAQAAPNRLNEELMEGGERFPSHELVTMSAGGQQVSVKIKRDVQNDNSQKEGESPKPNDEKLGSWKALMNPSYFALLWVYIVHKGVDKTYLGDIGKIGQSLGMDKLISTHMLIGSSTSVVTRLMSGVILDRFRGRISAWVYLFTALGILLSMDILLVMFMVPMYSSYLSSIGHGTASFLYAIMPATVAERFGAENMANGWSLMLTLSTLGTFAYGGWNSALYSAGAGADGICRGVHCFQVSFTIAACTILTGMGVLLWKGRHMQTGKDDEFV